MQEESTTLLKTVWSCLRLSGCCGHVFWKSGFSGSSGRFLGRSLFWKRFENYNNTPQAPLRSHWSSRYFPVVKCWVGWIVTRHREVFLTRYQGRTFPTSLSELSNLSGPANQSSTPSFFETKVFRKNISIDKASWFKLVLRPQVYNP